MNFENIINEIFKSSNSTISKDLKLNFQKTFKEGSLSEKNKMLVTYSLGHLLKLSDLKNYAYSRLNEMEVATDQLLEAIEISAFMKMLNTYYKFKNFVNNNADYHSAGLRMNAIARPKLSKVEFEILAFSHSLINGCEYCVKAHEQELRKDLSAEQIHDVARLVSVINSAS